MDANELRKKMLADTEKMLAEVNEIYIQTLEAELYRCQCRIAELETRNVILRKVN